MNYAEEIEAPFEWLRQQAEPLDEEVIELMLSELDNTLGRCSRICNLLLNRQRGLQEGVIAALSDIKTSISRIKWYREQRNLERTTLAEILSHASALARASESDATLAPTAQRLLTLLANATKA